LTNESQEYDWQNKWYECFGQSLYYGMKTGNINGCVLIELVGEGLSQGTLPSTPDL
jgi:hypothetical protein